MQNSGHPTARWTWARRDGDVKERADGQVKRGVDGGPERPLRERACSVPADAVRTARLPFFFSRLKNHMTAGGGQPNPTGQIWAIGASQAKPPSDRSPVSQNFDNRTGTSAYSLSIDRIDSEFPDLTTPQRWLTTNTYVRPCLPSLVSMDKDRAVAAVAVAD